MKKSVDEYMAKAQDFKKELNLLRSLLKSTEMTETVKWGIPTYTINGKNVVGLAGFKTYVGLWFFQGSFLKDPKNILVNAQEGKTKGQRSLRFKSLEEIDRELILAYVSEAIQNQKEGKEIKVDNSRKLEITEELAKHLQLDAKLQQAFNELTYGKQKEFAEYVASAKRQQTKFDRLKKITPMILEGVGLNDKYK